MAARIEDAVGALYSRLQDQIAGINKFARIYVEPNQVQSEQQPLLILQAVAYESWLPPTTKQEVIRVTPYIWQLHMAIIIYIKVDEAIDPSTLSPETTLNDFYAQIEDCLKWQSGVDAYDPSNNIRANLGGLVSRVTIEGPSVIMAGAGAQQGSLMVPVSLLMPT